jgi:hypothetical protein
MGMIEGIPGLAPRRLVRLMGAAVERLRLDLRGRVVLTEAASGPYVVTPILAAMAGAERVIAVTKCTAHGSASAIIDQTMKLARTAHVEARLSVVTEKNQQDFARADVVTNSGHVRPINTSLVEWMKPTAVIPLMYEAWEFRQKDVDLDACRRKGVAVAGTNECHPAVDIFSYLGVLAAKQLLDAGVAVYGSRLLLLCDNRFAPYMHKWLLAAGADVTLADRLDTSTPPAPKHGQYDAIIVSQQPRELPVLGQAEARYIAAHWPGAVVTQFFGDIDRGALEDAGVQYCPFTPPAPGHMGILPSAIGPDPIVRLQSSGLKVAEVLLRMREGTANDSDRSFIDQVLVAP